MIGLYVILGLALVILFLTFVTVQQGTVAVVTIFGKYRRLLTPGLPTNTTRRYWLIHY